MRFMQYRSTRKSVFSVKYHVIWCPKYRRDVLRGPIQARLKQIIGEVVAEFGGVVIEVETMPELVDTVTEMLWRMVTAGPTDVDGRPLPAENATT